MDHEFIEKYQKILLMGSSQLMGVICSSMFALSALNIPDPLVDQLTMPFALAVLAGQIIGAIFAKWIISLRK
ncbi:MAG: hypothetical protein VX409_05630 [Verrucomicrobiota bacterium]|nr:hypothetical protein [Verrucomicrobiota bacterium]